MFRFLRRSPLSPRWGPARRRPSQKAQCLTRVGLIGLWGFGLRGCSRADRVCPASVSTSKRTVGERSFQVRCLTTTDALRVCRRSMLHRRKRVDASCAVTGGRRDDQLMRKCKGDHEESISSAAHAEGAQRRSNRSMSSMRPPQHGQATSLSTATSVSDTTGAGVLSKRLANSTLALRAPLARKP